MVDLFVRPGQVAMASKPANVCRPYASLASVLVSLQLETCSDMPSAQMYEGFSGVYCGNKGVSDDLEGILDPGRLERSCCAALFPHA
jgi:hypothetical protein